MAAGFLASHGINLDDEITIAYNSTLESYGERDVTQDVDFTPPNPLPIRRLDSIISETSSVPQSLTITEDGRIGAVIPEGSEYEVPRFVLPSLAHPHIHLDKPFLLSHKDTCHLEPQTGTFEEALTLTGKAKSLYTSAALLERGAQLLADSSRAGITHLRGFCEVDAVVGLKCIEAGLKLKAAWSRCMYVQIAAFAQDPLFSALDGADAGCESDDQHGNQSLVLLQLALQDKGIEVLATTPYVESSLAASKHNIVWAVSTAIEHNLHLDFHLDYNLDPDKEPMIWFVLDELHKQDWVGRQKGNKTVCLGHCTRLTLFSASEWTRLAKETSDLPVYFIGLPTSDLFMQGRPPTRKTAAQTAAASHNPPRATLHIPSLLNLGLKAVLGINNIGNLFTPYGSADPLKLASWGVGIYQASTAEVARILYECVSWRAKEAIGLSARNPSNSHQNTLSPGDNADLIIFGQQEPSRKFVLQRRSIAEIIWNPPSEQERTVVYQGNRVMV